MICYDIKNSGGMDMVKSKFAQCVDLENGYYAFYNSLIMLPIFMNQEEYSKYENDALSEDIVCALKQICFYIDNKKDDMIALKRLRSQVYQHCGEWDILYLITTSSCNLACKYCFLDNNPNASTCNDVMTFEIAKEALDKFAKYGNRTDWEITNVLFYGGEPIINFSLIKEVIEYCNQKRYFFNYSVITNATLLTPEQALFLSANHVQIGVSLDGPQEITDKNRLFKSSNNSVYENVIEKLNILKDNKCNYSISCTIAPDVVNNREEFDNWIDNLGIRNIYFNIFHYADTTDEWKEYYPDMSEFMLEEYFRLLEKGIIEGKCSEIVNNFVQRKFKNNNCGAIGRNQVAIAANGDIFICQGDVRTASLSIGNISKDDPNDLLMGEVSETEKWTINYTVNSDECLNCEALPICGGGCPLQAEAIFSSRMATDKASCIFYKKALRFVLKKILQENLKK